MLGFAVLAVGLCAIPAPALTGTVSAKDSSLPATAAPIAASAGFKPHTRASPLASGREAASATPGPNWVDGAENKNATFLNFGSGDKSHGWDSAYVGYYPYTDSDGYSTGAYPQIGDVYYMHVVLIVNGNPWGGGDVPNIQVELPDDTQLAISSTTPMHCYLINGLNTSQYWDVSDESTCQTGPGSFLPIGLGHYSIRSYYIYEVQFPVKTTTPLDGLCTQTPLNGASIPGTVSPACFLNRNEWAKGEFSHGAQQFDWQGILVPAVAVDTTITSTPASSTTSTSAAFSFTSNLSGAVFQCSLDSGSWEACGSPESYSDLLKGPHTFSVVAVDPLGHVDPTPAAFGWTITSASGGGSGESDGGSHPTVTNSGSGKVSAAHLTKASFKRSQAAKVKITYKISPKSKHLTFLLSLKKGAKWVTVRSFKKTGSFKGSYTMSVKKLFGSKPIKAGSYRFRLSADKNSKVLSFRIT